MSAKKTVDFRYTEEDWEQVKPALRSLSVSTSDAAYQMLVKGRTAIDIADDFGCNRQTIYAAVERVKKRLKTHEIKGSIPVLAWIPESAIEEVKRAINAAGGTIDNGDSDGKSSKDNRSAESTAKADSSAKESSKASSSAGESSKASSTKSPAKGGRKASKASSSAGESSKASSTKSPAKGGRKASKASSSAGESSKASSTKSPAKGGRKASKASSSAGEPSKQVKGRNLTLRKED